MSAAVVVASQVMGRDRPTVTTERSVPFQEYSQLAMSVHSKASRIRLLLLDVDGVLTTARW